MLKHCTRLQQKSSLKIDCPLNLAKYCWHLQTKCKFINQRGSSQSKRPRNKAFGARDCRGTIYTHCRERTGGGCIYFQIWYRTRGDIVRATSSDDNDDDAKQASTNKSKIESSDVKNKTSSVMDLVRKNQMAYEKCITKKVLKLLRALGVSSDSGSSDEN